MAKLGKTITTLLTIEFKEKIDLDELGKYSKTIKEDEEFVKKFPDFEITSMGFQDQTAIVNFISKKNNVSIVYTPKNIEVQFKDQSIKKIKEILTKLNSFIENKQKIKLQLGKEYGKTTVLCQNLDMEKICSDCFLTQLKEIDSFPSTVHFIIPHEGKHELIILGHRNESDKKNKIGIITFPTTLRKKIEEILNVC